MKVAAVFLPITLFLYNSRAQTVPEFEVASIKPSPAVMSGDTFTVQMGGDPAFQDFTHVSLRSLVVDAYEIKEYELSGPDWMDAIRFDVHAKMPDGSSEKQVPAMMQKLLADRFHMAMHRETRTLPVYELVLAKGGIKTHAPDPKDEPKLQADGSHRMLGDVAGHGVISLSGREMTTADLAQLLSSAADRPVLDKTGLTGAYRFKMNWRDIETGSLSNALEESLGLKLEARKAPLQMVVVDHVDRLPVGN